MSKPVDDVVFEVYVNNERKGDFGGLVDLNVYLEKVDDALTVTSGKNVYYYRNAQPGLFKLSAQLGKVLLVRMQGGDHLLQEKATLFSGGRVQRTLTKITVESDTKDFVLTKDGQVI